MQGAGSKQPSRSTGVSGAPGHILSSQSCPELPVPSRAVTGVPGRGVTAWCPAGVLGAPPQGRGAAAVLTLPLLQGRFRQQLRAVFLGIN